MRSTERKQIKIKKQNRQISLKEALEDQLSGIRHAKSGFVEKVEFERSKKSG